MIAKVIPLVDQRAARHVPLSPVRSPASPRHAGGQARPDEAVFRVMNDVDFPVADVLKGIDAAHDAGFAPIKIDLEPA